MSRILLINLYIYIEGRMLPIEENDYEYVLDHDILDVVKVHYSMIVIAKVNSSVFFLDQKNMSNTHSLSNPTKSVSLFKTAKSKKVKKK